MIVRDTRLDLAATLPVVIRDTNAIYLYGLDIIAQQRAQARLYYMHDGPGSVRQVVDNTGDIATSYAYDPCGVQSGEALLVGTQAPASGSRD